MSYLLVIIAYLLLFLLIYTYLLCISIDKLLHLNSIVNIKNFDYFSCTSTTILLGIIYSLYISNILNLVLKLYKL